MTATFIILCIGANLLFFLLRRWEAKGKSSPNYIPDYGLKAELMAQVSSVIAKYGEKAASQLPSTLALPRAIRCFFNEYENLCLDADGVVLSRTFLATTYRGNDGFVQIEHCRTVKMQFWFAKTNRMRTSTQLAVKMMILLNRRFMQPALRILLPCALVNIQRTRKERRNHEQE